MSVVVIETEQTYEIVFLIFTILFLFLFIIFTKKPTDKKDLAGYLIHMNNVVSLFFGFIFCLVVTVTYFLDIPNAKVLTYIQDNIISFAYFMFFNSLVGYGVKLVTWGVNFLKDNEIIPKTKWGDNK